MNVPLAYLAVVIIWSTTPLGIVWSSESVHPTLAVLMRMLIAWLIGGILLVACKVQLPINKHAFKLYAFSALGIFGGMSFSYAAASYISSGMMSLIFGLSPILSGLLAQKIANEPAFDTVKKLALCFAVIGLIIVSYDNLAINNTGYLGLLYILIAVFFFSLSGVLVKTLMININPLATTFGALTFTLPLFILMWVLQSGELNYLQWQPRAIAAIIYLGIFGSLIGFVAYFYVLQKLSASTVALVTMITPVIAMTLGAILNNEIITVNLFVGACFVVLGLTGYQWSRKVKKLTIDNWSAKTKYKFW